MRIASIDIGTNTVRLLISELTGDGRLEKLCIDRVITRLGEGFSQNRRHITPNSISRTISALKNFSEAINKYQVNKTRSVATSVVRESENGNDFIDLAKKETGIDVEVISGDEEAELTVLGVLNSIKVNSKEYIIFDIGGGSTEYVHIINENIISKKSINMGVVHLTEEFLSNQVQSTEDIVQLSENIKEILDNNLIDFTPASEELSLIGTAGTPTTLAAMELKLQQYNPELINNHRLNRRTVSSIVEQLREIPLNQRSKIPGLEKGREDIIVAGSIILLQTLDRFSLNELIVSDGGVLEGIAHSIALQ